MFHIFKKDNNKKVHINEIEELVGSIELIDIREPYEYKSGAIRTAKNIPMGNLLDNPERYLIKDKEYYIMCHSGARSGSATRKLRKQGYTVVNVAGGMGSYTGNKRK